MKKIYFLSVLLIAIPSLASAGSDITGPLELGEGEEVNQGAPLPATPAEEDKHECYLEKHGLFWYVNMEGSIRYASAYQSVAKELVHKLQSDGVCMYEHEVGFRATYRAMKKFRERNN